MPFEIRQMRIKFMAKISFTVHFFKPSAVLRVTGEDAADFLQGQFSNDLRGPAGALTYGLWLNQKGKVLADSEILRNSDRGFRILSIFSTAAAITQRLEQYIIADDVVVEDQTPAMSALSVGGDGAQDLMKEIVGDTPVGRFLEVRGILVFPARNPSEPLEFILLGPNEAIQSMRTDFLARGGREVSDQTKEYARIAAGIPRIPADLGPADLPQEAGLEAMAISFTKGCYLGQEVMARLHSMGQVRRRLRRVRGTGLAPVHGAALYQGAKKVGEIRTSVGTSEGFVALAMLTRIGLDENEGLTLEASAEAPRVVSLWMN